MYDRVYDRRYCVCRVTLSPRYHLDASFFAAKIVYVLGAKKKCVCVFLEEASSNMMLRNG